jgi:hypothetical protein
MALVVRSNVAEDVYYLDISNLIDEDLLGGEEHDIKLVSARQLKRLRDALNSIHNFDEVNLTNV